MQSTNKIQRIGIASSQKTIALQTVKQLLKYIQKKHSNIELSVELNLKDELSGSILCFESIDTMCTHVDLIISIGGDGTLIQIASFAVEHNVPVLGINMGRLGYLTDIMPQSLELGIEKIIQGEYWIEDRLMLEADVTNHEQKLIALNEILLHRNNQNRMIEVNVFVNDNWVVKQRADGLIINTPTGSTAYALSAGGPIISPQLDAISIVPVCPHTLSYRPLVLNANVKITLKPEYSSRMIIQCSADGKQTINMQKNDEVKVKRYHKALRLVHPNSHNEFNVLRSKLNWG